MKTYFLIIFGITFLILQSCSKKTEERVSGVWEVNFPDTVNSNEPFEAEIILDIGCSMNHRFIYKEDADTISVVLYRTPVDGIPTNFVTFFLSHFINFSS